MKKTLLAGVAVAALLSVPALVFAQTSTSPGQSGTAPGQNRPPATSDAPGKSESAPGQNKPSANTAAPGRSESAPGQTRPDAAAQPGGRPDNNQRSGSNAKPDSNTTTTGRTGDNKPGDNSRAGDRSKTGGAAAGAAGGAAAGTAGGATAGTKAGTEGGNTAASVNLNTEQRTKVERAFQSVKVEPERNVNFNISVGAVVDSGVRFHPLPPTIVQVMPQFRGYEYVAVRDQIVIVEPRTRRIVYVMQHGNGRASINLTTEQRRMVKQKLASGPRMKRAIKIEDGMTVPPDIELRVIEQPIIAEVPEIRPYRYFVVEDEVVLVDPGTRQVIEIIR